MENWLIVSAIENGIPISTEGDLISREDLKKAITEATYNFEQIPIRVDKVMQIINNAPTVDTDEIYKKGYHAGFFTTHGEPERLQGEWIPVSERLPEKNGFYITTCQDICERRVHTVCYDAKNKEWSRGGVIAWKSFPEPYMKGGAE